MWRQPKFVACICKPEYIFCAVISATKHNFAQIHAAEYVPLPSGAIIENKIYNPTVLKRIIHRFIQQTRLRNPYVVCSFNGFQEQFITLPHASPRITDFSLPKQRHWYWQYHYAYPTDEGFVFYVCGIHQGLLLQYKLIMHPYQLTVIAPLGAATLMTYRTAYGTAFRHSQLGIHLMQYNHNYEQLISRDVTHRLFMPSQHITSDTWQSLVQIYGLTALAKEVV